MPTTWNAIFLGNSGTQLDPTEGNSDSEGAPSFVGTTFGSDADRLAKHIVSVETINDGGTADLDTNDTGNNDRVRFDLGDGAGTQTVGFDGIVVYDATLTYTDGSTATITAVVFQDENGNLFLAPELSVNADKAAMEAKPIRSLTLDSVNTSTSLNMAADRLVTNFVCYAAGTLVETPDGPRRVEELGDGDRLITLDHGAQPILWARSSVVAATGKRTPVRIRAGALGAGLPKRDLLVSRQHRMLVCSRIVQRMFGVDEVLIPAIRLVGLPGIGLAHGLGRIAYHHLLMEPHQILLAEGAPSESLLPGPFALEAMGDRARQDLIDRFPALAVAEAPVRPARPVPENRQQLRLVERHLRNAKPLLQNWGLRQPARADGAEGISVPPRTPARLPDCESSGRPSSRRLSVVASAQ